MAGWRSQPSCCWGCAAASIYDPAVWMFFLAGAVAIIAMILPGIRARSCC